MLGLRKIDHIAIIASDYQRSKQFYCDILGFTLDSEVYRDERHSWKGDLSLQGEYMIELFSFPSSPERVGYPEACGLRHLAFTVDDIVHAIACLKASGVACEAVRIDPYSGKSFTFFKDPDGLPLELYQR